MGDCLAISRTSSGTTILPFVRRKAAAGALSVSDRIEALRWVDSVRDRGVRSVRIHDPEPGDAPSVCGFLLVYFGDEIWARWGVAARGMDFEVWRPGTGATLGWYTTLADALAAIPAAA